MSPAHLGDGVFVRAIGYVAHEPVVARVGDGDLFVGNRHAAALDRVGWEFAHVVSVSADATPATTHHLPLTDGPAADWSAFAAAVDTARRLHRRDGHCSSTARRVSRAAAP